MLREIGLDQLSMDIKKQTHLIVTNKWMTVHNRQLAIVPYTEKIFLIKLANGTSTFIV